MLSDNTADDSEEIHELFNDINKLSTSSAYKLLLMSSFSALDSKALRFFQLIRICSTRSSNRLYFLHLKEMSTFGIYQNSCSIFGYDETDSESESNKFFIETLLLLESSPKLSSENLQTVVQDAVHEKECSTDILLFADENDYNFSHDGFPISSLLPCQPNYKSCNKNEMATFHSTENRTSSWEQRECVLFQPVLASSNKNVNKSIEADKQRLFQTYYELFPDTKKQSHLTILREFMGRFSYVLASQN